MDTKPSGKMAVLPTEYGSFLSELKERIRKAQIRAGLAANRELVLLYWHIGNEILIRQEKAGWGAKIIDRLSADLRHTFPELKGFSPRNIKYMRAFAEAYRNAEFVQRVAAQIPWFHHCILIDKVKSGNEREWYVRKTIEHGWSRVMLVHQIESGLYQRQGKAQSNFPSTLPVAQLDLAKQVFKDPYLFDFLNIGEEAIERELEQRLLAHLRLFLLELGSGFAFVGSQYRIQVDGEDYFIDLLFYHLRLRCFIVIDLKTTDFAPEHAGKMNFYLSAVDDLLRHSDDRPTIGLILCKSKKRLVVEYALRDMQKPIGVSAYKLTRALPKELEEALPSIEALKGSLDEKS
ncbi:MAG: PDDEXK nuclease domain-containing protein [bacterium]